MEETFRKEFDHMTTKYPGFRFSPTDVELISFYLKNKQEDLNDAASVIPVVEINNFEPWDLPAKCPIYSECEWYYFTSRGRKYPNGSQSKRATECGYWKATGRERNVNSGNTLVGTKRTLVFHIGRAPNGVRTDWIMHEYCVIGQSQVQDSLVLCRLRKNNYVSIFDGELHLEHEAEINEQSGSGEGMKVDYPKHNTSNTSVDQQNDSELPSAKKFAAGPSSQKIDEDDEEDLYAEILKDNLIDLDDALLPLYPSNFLLSTYPPEHRRTAQIPIETFQPNTQTAQIPTLLSNTPPVQTVANQRVRINSVKGQSSAQSRGKTSVTIFPKQKQIHGKKFPSCIVNLFQDKNIRFRYAYICAVFILGLLLLLWLVDMFMV
ncbi:NAC domain-containing protein 60-like [Impatiens glandulifera]|uniref:NAC domain-containing protein 60-like n=1 Tax=Impatiens glandulifera TaxID=253017 RepID=UPI001FB13A48|nr:NAC domain-containing protein 60-like [Impatiens glandulifera]XP_047324481.1 NAC domain-containing protein 60-like [Impatiens glandulifera]